ncbi:MAG: 2TM domain-containing protein [Cyanobacteria bacterium J06650_10]
MADLYASEEAQQILQIAIAKETEAGDLTRTQLAEIAAELNIAPETLWSAEQEWIALKSEASQQALFNQQKRQRFHHHLIRYGIFNSFLLLLSIAMSWYGLFWFVAIAWGCAATLHGWRAYQSSGYRYQKDFESWQRRQQVKQSVKSLFNRLLNA